VSDGEFVPKKLKKKKLKRGFAWSEFFLGGGLVVAILIIAVGQYESRKRRVYPAPGERQA
jgi:hypothetical protein